MLLTVSAGGALPTGLTENVQYYVNLVSGTTVNFTNVPNGAAISTSSAGSGTFSLYVNSGITAEVLNQSFQISNVNTNTYDIESPVAAGVYDTGNGGNPVNAYYEINVGKDAAQPLTGWGAGPWSRGGWGSSATTTISGAQLRIWSQDNYGEDLLMAVHDGGLYYWETSAGLSVRAVALSSLAGANSTPTVVKQVIVSERDRHVIVFGCDPETDPGVQDPLVIRFSSQESLTDWETRADNTAGELRLGSGSEIIGAVQTKQQVIVFTDVSIHAMQYIGPPYTFGVQEVSSGVSIMGPNAMVAIGDVVFWMGKGEFYVYSGSVAQIPCDVKEYIFNNLNISQALKINAGHNSSFSEVWWFYPSANSSENDSYVVYNYDQKIWYYGSMPRTAWVDRGVFGNPIAASSDNYLYYQDSGFNDGSNNPPTALSPYIESSVVDLGEGDQFMFATRVIPDLTFRNSTAANPTATFTIKARNFPGDNFISSDANAVTKTASIPVEQFTDQVFIRMRGRSMSIRVESSQTNTSWRLGDPRLDVRTDGRR